MLKIVLVGIGVLALGAGLFVYFNTPSTQLVDASGAALTSGLPAVVPEPVPDSAPAPESPRLLAGPEFEEPQRLIAAGNHAAAKQTLVALLETSDRDGETCILLSDACRELEELDEAVDYGLKAIELLPDVGRAHHSYAKALALKMMMGDNKLAAMVLLPKWKNELAVAIELEPENVDARLEQLTFYTYLPAMIGGDTDKALELCAELEQHAPARGKLWTALVHQQRDELDRAIELCKEGIAEFPEDKMFPSTLGNIYAKQERFEEADAAFELAKQGARGEAYYRTLVSQASMHVDHELDREKAIELMEEYLAYHPDIPMMPPNAMVRFKQGQALAQLGRKDEARAAYEACLREQPQHTQAKDALAELDA